MGRSTSPPPLSGRSSLISRDDTLGSDADASGSVYLGDFGENSENAEPIASADEAGSSAETVRPARELAVSRQGRGPGAERGPPPASVRSVATSAWDVEGLVTPNSEGPREEGYKVLYQVRPMRGGPSRCCVWRLTVVTSEMMVI